MEQFSPRSLRVTAGTDALDNGADISEVQNWLGHANIFTTRLYDRRKMRCASQILGREEFTRA